MLRKWALISLGWLLLILSACGWQLRDAQLLPDSIGTVYLSSKQAHGPLINELTRAIDAFGVEVASTADKAEQSLMIVDYKQSRRISTLNSSARVAEYQLNEQVDYLILDKNGMPLAPLATASAQRTYEFDETDILGSANEQQRLTQSMHATIIRQMLTHLDVVINR
jgi:LPS-assembly lipoprotein